MTDFQFYVLTIAIAGWGLGLGLGIAKVFDRLCAINRQLEILPEISDRLAAVNESLRSAQRESRNLSRR